MNLTIRRRPGGPARRIAATAATALAALALTPGVAADTPLCIADDGLYCFNARDLSLRWRAREDRTTQPPAGAGPLTVIAGSDGLSAYAADGRRVWHLADIGATFAPRVRGSAVYAGTRGGEVVRVEAATGAVTWRTRPPGLTGWMYSPALLRQVVVSGGQDGTLVALRRQSGVIAWRLDLQQELVYHPAEIAPDRFAVTTFDGRIRVIDDQGTLRWERRLSVASRTPVVLAGHLYCALFDGRLIALGIDDGVTDWQVRFDTLVTLHTTASVLLAYNDDEVAAFAPSGQRLWRRGFDSRVVGVRDLPGQRLAVFLRDAGSTRPRGIALALRPDPQPVAAQ